MSDDYTGADLFVDTLEQYGVEHVFGNPGTTELPVMEALSHSDLEYVLGLQEDIAVGMAAGYAQTRRYHAHHDPSVNPVGVVNLHITPGLAHGTGNIFNAEFSGAPLVVTAGNHELDFRHEEPLLDGDLEQLVDQFCKDSAEVTDIDALPLLLRRAMRTALTPPTGPVFLGLPVDVMLEETDDDPLQLGEIPDAGAGDPTQIDRAADQLVEADEPVLVLGDHVARAGRDAVEAAVDLAEASGARVHGEILASEANFPTDHEQWVSFVGTGENIAKMLMDTDTIAFVGCSTHTTLLKHESPLLDEETTAIHVTPDAHELGKNYHVDAGVLGDPGRVMTQLAEKLEDRLDEETRQERVDNVVNTKEMLAGTMQQLGEDPTPEGDTRASKADLVDTMSEVLDVENTHIVDEGVTSKFALLTRYELQPESFVATKGGGLGYGLPASVGAALAEEQTDDPRDVIGYIGDGSYLYYPNSMYTAAALDLDLTVVVPDNRNYRILKDNTLEMMGGTEEDYEFVGMDFDPHVDIPKNAESHGARGQLVETPEEIAPALEAALDADGPDVLDILVHD
ncbi:thiamine pyrophosphate-binding protein [Haloglomus halophilum]|uniref:thiamine pyrophosphate-binding protein n=1 Tax=Haloglomus halophilum TaxID=2962672 RepID=UPI0020C9B476|nr:thiamine pyrophosphate-binding protein [Haloglomus halophilum]